MNKIIRRLPTNIVEILPLIILFILSLGIRLHLLFAFPRVITLFEADAIGYFAIAKNILNNWHLGDTSTHFPPFYSFFIAAVLLFTGDVEISGRLVSCILGAFLVFPVYCIGRELYDKRAGFLSAVAVTTTGTLIDSSLQPLSQATYLALLATATYLGMVLLRKHSPFISLLLGITTGATYLTRPEGIVIFAFISSTLLVSTWWNDNITAKQKITMISSMVFGFLIMALPYINYLHEHIGIWTISGKAVITIIGFDASAKLLPDGTTVGESVKGKMGISNVFLSIQDFLNTYWQNIKRFEKVLKEDLPFIYLLFALCGFSFLLMSIFKAKNGSRMKMLQLLIGLGGFVAVLPVFVFSNLPAGPFYILPVFPMLIIFFSVGVIYLEDMLMKFITSSGRAFYLKKRPVISVIVVVALSYASLSQALENVNSKRYRYFQMGQGFLLKETGEWLKYNTPEEAVIMTRWSNIGFYADRRTAVLPDGEISEVIKYARAHDVRYIVVDSESVPGRLPRLFPLLVTSLFDEKLLKEAYSREKYGLRVKIYEVICQ